MDSSKTTFAKSLAEWKKARRFKVYPGALMCLRTARELIPDLNSVTAMEKIRYRRHPGSSLWYTRTGDPPAVPIPAGAVVLCLSNDEDPANGSTVLRFLYEQQFFTLRGYFLPQEYFREVEKDVEEDRPVDGK